MGRFEEAMGDYTRALAASGTGTAGGAAPETGSSDSDFSDVLDADAPGAAVMARLRSGGLRGVPRVK